MLSATERGIPAETRTRLVVEPARQVSVSVLPSEDPARAEDVSLEAGSAGRVLRAHDAVVRQTHRSAGVVVLDVPEDRQVGLQRDLEAAGFVARPPKPVYALLNESVPALHVPAVWQAGVDGEGIGVGIVNTVADRHPAFGDRSRAYRDITDRVPHTAICYRASVSGM